jgi:MFS family permease
MDLYCADENNLKISLFGSSLMVGLMVGSVFLTNLSDVYGRKPILLFALGLNTIMTIPLILFQNNYWITIFTTFLFGITAACRYSVSYMYSVELSTTKNSSFYGILCLIGDSLSSVFLGIYFIFVKSVTPSLWFMLVTNVASIFVIWHKVPESPSYLFSMNLKSKFVECLSQIAKFNLISFDPQQLEKEYDTIQEALV